MELKEALSKLEQIPNLLDAFKQIDDLLTLVLESERIIPELTARVENLRKEEAELSLLKENREGLIAEIRLLNKEKNTARGELDKLKAEHEALKAKLLSL